MALRRCGFSLLSPTQFPIRKMWINLGWKVCKIQRPFQLNSSPEGVLRISSKRDDRMAAKIQTQKNPVGFKQNPKKSLDQNLSPKKTHAEFPSHNKNFQEA